MPTDHPLDRPLFHWYRKTPFGPELVVCLYTRGCRYRACSFCSLPSVTAGDLQVPYREINTQVDFALGQLSAEELDAVVRVSLFNNGSTLDQETLPTKSLLYFLLKASDLPNLAVVSLETRAEYVEDWELKVLRQILPDRAALEISLGFETFSEKIRNQVLRKGLTEAMFESLLALLSANRCRLKCYVMLKPDVTLTEQEGVEEAVRTIEYLGGMSEKHKVEISVHLNPTYVARGSRLENDFRVKGYRPPDLSGVVEVLLKTESVGLWTYVGLDDEGLAAPGGEFRSELQDRARVIATLERFNATNDYRLLTELVSTAA